MADNLLTPSFKIFIDLKTEAGVTQEGDGAVPNWNINVNLQDALVGQAQSV